ncbi:MAG: tetratricopeptide repeat protein [Pseudomonadota bacterium]
MHEQSPFFSAPVLSALALAMVAVTFVAEIIVRSDEDTSISRAISSDDQQEIETFDESDLDADAQEDLIAIVQDAALSPLDQDKLRGTLLFRTANTADRYRFQATIGKMLAKRKRHEEALAVLSALPPEQRIEHDASFSYAQSFRGAGNVEAAIAAYAQHIAANPNHNPGYVNYGILLAETGQHEQAIRVFERSVEITSSSRKGKSLSLLGQSQVALGAYDESIDSFDLSIQYRPDNGPTWRRFATSKARSGTYPSEEIEADYIRAMALDPGNAETMKEWAEFNFSLGRFEDALPLFRAASEERANDFDILFSRAVNLMASERPRAGRQIIRKMANIEMSSEQKLLLKALQEAGGVIRPPTQETLNEVCAARGETERLIYSCLLLQLELQDMESALETFAELPESSTFAQPAGFALAQFEYRNGAAASAAERLDVLLTKNPESPLFWLYKARTLAQLEPPTETTDEAALSEESSDETSETTGAAGQAALTAFQKALELNPESRKITLEFAEQLTRLKLYERAELLLSGYLLQHETDAPVLTALANVYVAAGEPAKAEDALLQLVEMSEEDDAAVTQRLVAVQVVLEKYNDALENADNLLDQDPANIVVRRLRVSALTELGREEDAAAEEERIMRLMPAETEESGAVASGEPAVGAAAP